MVGTQARTEISVLEESFPSSVLGENQNEHLQMGKKARVDGGSSSKEKPQLSLKDSSTEPFDHENIDFLSAVNTRMRKKEKVTNLGFRGNPTLYMCREAVSE